MAEENDGEDFSKKTCATKKYPVFTIVFDYNARLLWAYFKENPEHRLIELFSNFRLPPVELKMEKISRQSIGLMCGILFPKSILLKKYFKLNIVPITDKQTRIEIILSDNDDLRDKKKLNIAIFNYVIKFLRILKDIFWIIDRLL